MNVRPSPQVLQAVGIEPVDADVVGRAVVGDEVGFAPILELGIFLWW